MNEVMLFVEIAAVFTMLLAAQRMFGKAGVMAWIPLATVTANILTVKNACIFGLNTAIGTVMFGSTFLATDILTECYGVKYARRGVLLGFCGAVMFIVSSQIALLYVPSPIDYASESMSKLFNLNLRVSLSSIVMYLAANMADVFMYERLRVKTDGRKLWLRNNVSTILCNSAENFGFVLIGFYGLYDFRQCVSIACSISIIEAIVGICDTPFLYVAVRKRNW